MTIGNKGSGQSLLALQNKLTYDGRNGTLMQNLDSQPQLENLPTIHPFDLEAKIPVI
jgi:hypothetical protein